MESKRYYSLKFMGSNAWHGKGDVLKTGSPVLTIGESADCEVRYEAPEGCTDELYYATIKVSDDGHWVLIRRSPLVKVTVAGREDFSYMIRLSDGDLIEFEGQSMALRFSEHNDANYSEAGVTIVKDNSSKKVIYSLFALIAVALIAIGGYLYSSRPVTITDKEVEFMEEAILRIDVDSVQYLRVVNGNAFVIKTLYLDSDKPSGTAFLTHDGLLVTARHCVEYWLGEDAPHSVEEIDNPDGDPVFQWAAEAETYNYTHEGNDTLLALRSYCTLYDKDKILRKSFASSTIDTMYIDRSRDCIYPIDNFRKIYYWRTVTPRFENRRVEVGDIFCRPMKLSGMSSDIHLADEKRVVELKKSDPLFFFGYSETENGNEGLKTESGMIKEDFPGRDNHQEHNIIHSGNLNHGFSGGPVIARCPGENGFAVVGVISKCDSKNSHLQMSVPVTAIKEGGRK